jgi:hypothetical protein
MENQHTSSITPKGNEKEQQSIYVGAAISASIIL